MSFNKTMIPVGKHYGLNIRKPVILEDAGPMGAGGPKIIWHTTEGGTVDSVINTLRSKRAAVHFVIDGRTGEVVQLIPLNRAGRGLEHVFGPETNRANAVQVEIVGFAALSSKFDYKHLAALALLIEHRTGVARKMAPGAGSFLFPKKMAPEAFVRASGHLGHVHVPGNNHTDPGRAFMGSRLRRLMKKV